MARTASEKSRQPKPERLRREADKLRARLAEIDAHEKKITEQNQTIVGRAIMKLAEADPKFKEELGFILERALTDKGERKLLGLSAPPRRGKGSTKRKPEARPSPEGPTGEAET